MFPDKLAVLCFALKSGTSTNDNNGVAAWDNSKKALPNSLMCRYFSLHLDRK